MMEERIEKHIYQYVEAELRNYPTYKKLIADYDKELLYSGAKSGLAKDPSGRFPENQTSDSVHNEVVKIMANESRIVRAKDVVMCIEDVLEELSEQDKQLVEMKYFKGYYTDFGIMRELRFAERTYYRHKRDLIRRFALRMRVL
ncbi:transcriptional regulator [Desulfitobacterium hafniense]|uniref:transcriptional regulator n=1 Tax=Desulfitobacterium hafniense TaxID=49338 RepID=UPI00036A09FA|nr:transcriptional regulator [Desulfitobacterium hafniense]